MRLPSWLRRLAARSALVPAPKRKRPAPCRLMLEVLEARDCPSSGGLLDPTFGSGGIVTTVPVSGGRIVTEGGASAIQSDGKIVVVGYSYNTASLNTGYIDLVRYNANGTLDTTFGKSGIVTTKYGSRVSTSGVAIDPTSGKIILEVNEGSTQLLFRYNTNGTLDKTFNNGTGDVLVSFPGYANFGTSGITVETVSGVPKLLVYGP